MSTKIPINELARRLCSATHRSDLAPGPTGGVPCAEHKRLAQLYYGLLDERSQPMVVAIWEATMDQRVKDD